LIERKQKQLFALFATRLFEWFSSNARSFPWRETRNPYKILVAEIMLQKTTSKQAEETFHIFFKHFPSIQDLAMAPLERIEEYITPLGLEHIRAARLKKLAQEIVEKYEGQIPRDKKTLLSLPGVGEYIANAVLCLAYDEDLPLLDTNQLRVFDRVFDIKSSKKRARTDKAIWKFAENIIPKGKGKDFNLGILDFASLVCRARDPKCESCPMNSFCRYFAEHMPCARRF